MTAATTGQRAGRIAAATAVTLGLLPVAGAGSHPGHGPPLVDIAEFKYTPATVNVVEGDYVFWDWPGADKNHSVTADDGTFDSDAGKTASQVDHKTGDGFSAQFKKAGTYAYHCKVHSFMTGKVVVAALPAGSQPGPGTKPRLSKVHVAVHGKRLALRFTVNEAVSMRATVRRASGAKVLREFDFSGPPGANRRTLRLGALPAGRYRLALVAIDASTGISTTPARRAFTLS